MKTASGGTAVQFVEHLGSAHDGVTLAALEQAARQKNPDAAEISIEKLVQALRPLRTVTININGHELTADPAIDVGTQEILDSIAVKSTHQRWRKSGQGLVLGQRAA